MDSFKGFRTEVMAADDNVEMTLVAKSSVTEKLDYQESEERPYHKLFEEQAETDAREIVEFLEHAIPRKVFLKVVARLREVE